MSEGRNGKPFLCETSEQSDVVVVEKESVYDLVVGKYDDGVTAFDRGYCWGDGSPSEPDGTSPGEPGGTSPGEPGDTSPGDGSGGPAIGGGGRPKANSLLPKPRISANRFGRSNSGLLAGPAAAGVATAGLRGLFAPTPCLPKPAARYWGPKEYGAWFNSLPKRDAVGKDVSKVFQRAVCGPKEYSVQGSGDDAVWSDKVMGTKIIDAKLVETPANSPQLGTSSKWFEPVYRGKILKEFGRYKSAILDPSNPLRSVEVRVNAVRGPSDASVKFWENFLAERGIPGKVVVAGEISTVSATVASITVPRVSAGVSPLSNSSAFWRANAEVYKGNAGAIGAAALFSAVAGYMKGVTDANNCAGIELIANPNALPDNTLHNIQYFRDQSSGLDAFLFGRLDKERRQYAAQGNALPTKMETFLDTAEQYWKARKAAAAQREAKAQSLLPDPNGSLFGPRE